MENFLETICVTDGDVALLDLHQQRMWRTGEAFDFQPPKLEKVVPEIPFEWRKGKVKLRIVYRKQVELVEFIPYTPKKIKALRLVEGESIDYTYKYADRRCFDPLLAGLPKGTDVIIVQKGAVTDCSYANLVFERAGIFYTPEKPLLKGIKRQYLIEKGIIVPKRISSQEVGDYERIHLLNAMLDLGEMVVDVRNVENGEKEEKDPWGNRCE